ncbi:LacI family DNA-binding transcriptional regulator [Corynebacterium poyangense]|uniref:LacI family DNA-binding transcriptional regulator n=1 Tax=Corynebacterium poyangense TaxID=2684405 RepID=UPI001CCA51B2|nr:LacI family DNA-binding transcriptional regulator [Corynebacterium poyangense]
MTSIYDVARIAGVSAATVSRALNRPDLVSSATAEKVMEAITKVGYRTHATAPPDSSSTPRTGVIGIVIADLLNPFFLEIVRGAEHAARSQNRQLLVANAAESERRFLEAIDAMLPLVDGVLLASPRLSTGQIHKIARTRHTVVLNRPVAGVASVMADNYAAAVAAAEYLAATGTRSITYLAGPEDAFADGLRWRGLLDAAGEPSTDKPLTLIHPPTPIGKLKVHKMRATEPTIRGGHQLVRRWYDCPTDAVLCFNELISVGFMHGAQQLGLRVPEDVKVVGFDNTEFAQIVTPSLTTAAAPLRLIGSVGAALVMSHIEGLRKPQLQPRILPTKLIRRQSA